MDSPYVCIYVRTLIGPSIGACAYTKAAASKLGLPPNQNERVVEMNLPAHTMNPDKSSALTDVPRTRWVSVALGHLHQRSGEAYLKAQARGFSPGHELDAWLCVMADLVQKAKE